MTIRSPHRNRMVLAGAAVVVSLALGGCTAMNGPSAQARAGDDKGYVAGDGSVEEFTPAQRGKPITVSGTDSAGRQVSSDAFRGRVLVLNLWYASCGPCRNEAPDLAKIAGQTAPDHVAFLGIDTRDDAPTAAAFERTFEMPYPSIVDQSGRGRARAARGGHTQRRAHHAGARQTGPSERAHLRAARPLHPQ